MMRRLTLAPHVSMQVGEVPHIESSALHYTHMLTYLHTYLLLTHCLTYVPLSHYYYYYYYYY